MEESCAGLSGTDKLPVRHLFSSWGISSAYSLPKSRRTRSLHLCSILQSGMELPPKNEAANEGSCSQFLMEPLRHVTPVFIQHDLGANIGFCEHRTCLPNDVSV